MTESDVLERIAQLDADPEAFLQEVRQTELARAGHRSARLVLMEKAIWHASQQGRGMTRMSLEQLSGFSRAHVTQLLSEGVQEGRLRSEQGAAAGPTGLERMTVYYWWASDDPPMG